MASFAGTISLSHYRRGDFRLGGHRGLHGRGLYRRLRRHFGNRRTGVELEHQRVVAARNQLMAAGLGQIDHDASGRSGLAIRAEADILHSVAVDTDQAARGRDYRVGQIDHDARRRVQRAQLGLHRSVGPDLHTEAVVGTHDVYLLQCGVLRSVRARALRLGRGGDEDHHQHRQ